MIRSMKKNTVCEMTTTRTDRLLTNFKSDIFDQYSSIKDGDTVNLTVTLLGIDH